MCKVIWDFKGRTNCAVGEDITHYKIMEIKPYRQVRIFQLEKDRS